MGYIGAGISRFNTADELTVTGDATIDTTTLVVDSTNNRVGILNASPTTALDVTGTVTADGIDVQGDGTISGGSRLTISDIADVNNDGIRLDDSTTSRFNNLTQDSSGNFKIQHWTGSAWQNNLTLTTGSNLGIGFSPPRHPLHVYYSETGAIPTDHNIGASTDNKNYLGFHNSSDSATYSGIALETRTSGSSRWLIANEWKNTYLGDLVFRTRDGGSSSSETVRFTSAGNVGIGTAAPDRILSISGGASADTAIIRSEYDDTGYYREFGRNNSTGNFEIRRAQGGSASTDFIIDTSGNLLVGKTADNVATVGIEARATGPLISTRDGSDALRLNRLNSDGEIIQLRKDGTTVGSISSSSGDIEITGANNVIYVTNVRVLDDNTRDIGTSSKRFNDAFIVNGVTTGSDKNEKQQIASLTDAEMTAAKAISKLFKTFKWNSAVTAKGDAARTHTGVIAQEIQAAMSATGLDATKYAFWCSDTWTNDDGNEQTRMGVRYPELLSFVGAATEQRLTDIETRLAALEE